MTQSFDQMKHQKLLQRGANRFIGTALYARGFFSNENCQADVSTPPCDGMIPRDKSAVQVQVFVQRM